MMQSTGLSSADLAPYNLLVGLPKMLALPVKLLRGRLCPAAAHEPAHRTAAPPAGCGELHLSYWPRVAPTRGGAGAHVATAPPCRPRVSSVAPVAGRTVRESNPESQSSSTLAAAL